MACRPACRCSAPVPLPPCLTSHSFASSCPPAQAPTGGKGGVPLGSRGILVSCTNSKETPAGREAADLFTEASESQAAAGRQESSDKCSSRPPRRTAA